MEQSTLSQKLSSKCAVLETIMACSSCMKLSRSVPTSRNTWPVIAVPHIPMVYGGIIPSWKRIELLDQHGEMIRLI